MIVRSGRLDNIDTNKAYLLTFNVSRKLQSPRKVTTNSEPTHSQVGSFPSESTPSQLIFYRLPNTDRMVDNMHICTDTRCEHITFIHVG